jgi:Na+/H+-dicarboxylate symporter
MFEAMIKIVGGILRVTPIAVACILAWVFASQGGAMIYALSKLLLSLYIGLFIVIALFILLVSLLGYKPILPIKRISAALIIGFSLMDVGRTTVNVLGNTFAVLLLNRFFGNRAAPKFFNARGDAAMVPAQ